MSRALRGLYRCAFSFAVMPAVLVGCSRPVARLAVPEPTTAVATTTRPHSPLYTWWQEATLGSINFDAPTVGPQTAGRLDDLLNDLEQFTTDWNKQGTPFNIAGFSMDQVNADVAQIQQDLPPAQALPPPPDPMVSQDFREFLADVQTAVDAWSPGTTFGDQTINDLNAADRARAQLAKAIPDW